VRKSTILRLPVVVLVELLFALLIGSLDNKLIVEFGCGSQDGCSGVLESFKRKLVSGSNEKRRRGGYMHSLVPLTEFFGRTR